MKPTFVLHTDGGSRGNPGPAGIGAVLQDQAGHIIATISEGIGWATNNLAEYRALIEGLKTARSNGVERLTVYSDSLLVVQQMRGIYKVKNKSLKDLFVQAKALAEEFEAIRFEAIPREQNVDADELANRGMDEWLHKNPNYPPHRDAQEQRELF